MHHVPKEDMTIEVLLEVEEHMARETAIREALHQGSSPVEMRRRFGGF